MIRQEATNTIASSLLEEVARRAEDYTAFSDRIWTMPETCYAETRSAAEHLAMLEREGFSVTRKMADIPTALMGEAGSGGPVIAFLGEYDALAGLSQKAGALSHEPLMEGGNGHGCGHNLLGAGALLAASALKAWLVREKLPGRVRYYGCPAEEGGAAKAFMVRAGAFDDVDIAITWHPNDHMEVVRKYSLANCRVDFTFHGTPSHAGVAPHLGRSALDAVELMSVGCNYLREHVPANTRLHYAYLDTGGISPNVVQSRAKVRYSIRSEDAAGAAALLARVEKIARGAAMMTETDVEIRVISAVSNKLPNPPLEAAMQDVMEQLGPPDFDAEDHAFAQAIRETFSPDDIAASWRSVAEPMRDAVLSDFVVPAHLRRDPTGGSTDVADVSWIVPTVEAHVATATIGTKLHSWQMVSQGQSPMAHKGMIRAAEIMAGTAYRAIVDPDLIARAKAALKEAVGPDGYRSLLPAEAAPPIADMAIGTGRVEKERRP